MQCCLTWSAQGIGSGSVAVEWALLVRFTCVLTWAAPLLSQHTAHTGVCMFSRLAPQPGALAALKAGSAQSAMYDPFTADFSLPLPPAAAAPAPGAPPAEADPARKRARTSRWGRPIAADLESGLGHAGDKGAACLGGGAASSDTTNTSKSSSSAGLGAAPPWHGGENGSADGPIPGLAPGPVPGLGRAPACAAAPPVARAPPGPPAVDQPHAGPASGRPAAADASLAADGRVIDAVAALQDAMAAQQDPAPARAAGAAGAPGPELTFDLGPELRAAWGLPHPADASAQRAPAQSHGGGSGEGSSGGAPAAEPVGARAGAEPGATAAAAAAPPPPPPMPPAHVYAVGQAQVQAQPLQGGWGPPGLAAAGAHAGPSPAGWGALHGAFHGGYAAAPDLTLVQPAWVPPAHPGGYGGHFGHAQLAAPPGSGWGGYAQQHAPYAGTFGAAYGNGGAHAPAWPHAAPAPPAVWRAAAPPPGQPRPLVLPLPRTLPRPTQALSGWAQAQRAGGQGAASVTAAGGDRPHENPGGQADAGAAAAAAAAPPPPPLRQSADGQAAAQTAPAAVAPGSSARGGAAAACGAGGRRAALLELVEAGALHDDARQGAVACGGDEAGAAEAEPGGADGSGALPVAEEPAAGPAPKHAGASDKAALCAAALAGDAQAASKRAAAAAPPLPPQPNTPNGRAASAGVAPAPDALGAAAHPNPAPVKSGSPGAPASPGVAEAVPAQGASDLSPEAAGGDEDEPDVQSAGGALPDAGPGPVPVSAPAAPTAPAVAGAAGPPVPPPLQLERLAEETADTRRAADGTPESPPQRAAAPVAELGGGGGRRPASAQQCQQEAGPTSSHAEQAAAGRGAPGDGGDGALAASRELQQPGVAGPAEGSGDPGREAEPDSAPRLRHEPAQSSIAGRLDGEAVSAQEAARALGPERAAAEPAAAAGPPSGPAAAGAPDQAALLQDPGALLAAAERSLAAGGSDLDDLWAGLPGLDLPPLSPGGPAAAGARGRFF